MQNYVLEIGINESEEKVDRSEGSESLRKSGATWENGRETMNNGNVPRFNALKCTLWAFNAIRLLTLLLVHFLLSLSDSTRMGIHDFCLAYEALH